MKIKRALIIGATGAVGKEVLNGILNDDSWKQVKVLARKPNPNQNPKLQWIVTADFFEPSLSEHFNGITHLFICVGTTKAKTPNKEEYKIIDRDIPMQMSTWAMEADVYHCLVVSSIGAKSSSSVFYLKTKGEMEEGIRKTHMARIDFFRPSTIVGDRPENRPGEKLGIVLDSIFRPLIPKKYRAIKAQQLALRMIQLANETEDGVYYHYNDTLLD